MSQKLRAGIIGCGNISAMHAANYERSEQVELVAAADLFPAAREKFQGQHPTVHTYATYAAMLEQERLDLVSVCTPPSAHQEPALAVARARVRGLLLEKPMALTLPDADRVIQECAANGVKLAIGHQLRCAATYTTARSLMDAGKIGVVERVWGICHGAPLQTNATHTIDLMNYLVGDLPVSWVMGSLDIGEGRILEGIRQEKASVGLFAYTGGPIGMIESGDLPPNRGYHRIFLDGSEGQIELAHPGGPGIRLRSRETGGEWQTPALVAERNPVDNLAEAILNGNEPLASGAAGRAVLEIILALAESARTLRRVGLPLNSPLNPLDQIYAGENPGRF